MRKKNTKIKTTEDYQNFIEKILKIKPTVASILKKHLETRDDDTILITRVWEHQGVKDDFSFSKIKEMLYLGKIAPPETIRRGRQLLQEKNPELRGKLYDDRHKQEKLMKKQIKINFDI